MFHVTIIGDNRSASLLDRLRRRGCVVTEIHYSAFLGTLWLRNGTASDVVVCCPVADQFYRTGCLTYYTAKAIQAQLSGMSRDVCMADGRKWSAVPFVMLFDRGKLHPVLIDVQSASAQVHAYFDDKDAFRVIKAAVDEYKAKVIAGFDNLGFLVTYKNGRLRVGPALGSKKSLENDFYNGEADQSRTSRSGLVTIDRDVYGLQYEVEQLEFLINKKDREGELQSFFEENPHFLATHRQGIPVAHPRFPVSDSEHLIPDFVVRPAVGSTRDSNWEILDLKLPNQKLLAGKGKRTRFTSAVMNAVAQLKDYGEYFKNPNNESVIRAILSHHLGFPDWQS